MTFEPSRKRGLSHLWDPGAASLMFLLGPESTRRSAAWAIARRAGVC